MGALTDMYDRWLVSLGEKAHNAARYVFEDAGEELLYSDQELSEYAESNYSFVWGHDSLAKDTFVDAFVTWFRRYMGKEEPQKFFIFYGFNFKKDPEEINRLKAKCAKFGLDCYERISTDNDFFLFHPIEHGPGLVIVNNWNCNKSQLCRMFSDIITDNGPLFNEW